MFVLFPTVNIRETYRPWADGAWDTIDISEDALRNLLYHPSKYAELGSAARKMWVLLSPPDDFPYAHFSELTLTLRTAS